jgi:DNA-binding CsgD family transcriptional regulator
MFRPSPYGDGADREHFGEERSGGLDTLTPRELEVLRLIARDRSNAEIGVRST